MKRSEVELSKRTEEVDYSPIRQIVQLSEGMEGVIAFALGEPGFDTPAHIMEAAIKAINEGFTHYVNPWGIMELREEIAKKLKRENGIEADPESEVLVTIGAAGSLWGMFQATINPGDHALIPDPGYPSYPYLTLLAGGTYDYVPMGDEEHFKQSMEEIETKIKDRTKMIVLNSPLNPNGFVLSKKNLNLLAEVAKQYNLLVLSDEPYEKFVYDGIHYSIASFPEMKDRTISVFSFSKSYSMAGWRVGYVTSNSEILDRIAKVNYYSVTHTDSIAQKAAVAALKGPHGYIKEMVDEMRKRRDFIVRRLNEISGVSCEAPKGTFYVFPDISRLNKSSFELAKLLLYECKVLTVHGSAFGPHGEGHLRISLGIPKEKIQEGINRFEKVAQKLSIHPSLS